MQNLFNSGRLNLLTDIDGSFLLSFKEPIKNKGYLYKSLLCKSSLYFRKLGTDLQWSTNPLDLLDNNIASVEQIDPNLLLLTCLGESIPPNRSYFKDINRLPAGSLLIYNNGNITIKQIDRLKTFDFKGKSIFDYALQTKKILDRTVSTRLKSDEKVGVLLSGGLDSSVVLYTLKELGIPVYAYHWSFNKIKSANEVDYAKAVTNHLNIPLYEIDTYSVIKDSSYLNEKWNFGTAYNHGFYRLFELTRNLCQSKGIKILAGGYLADNIFGPPLNFNFFSTIKSIPLREKFSYLKEALGTPKLSDESNLNYTSFPRISWYRDYLTDSALNLIEPLYKSIRFPHNLEEYLPAFSNNETESTLESHLFNYEGMKLFHLFNSRELMEFSLSIPLGYRLIPTGGQWIDKPILRLAYIGRLPSKIISRNHRQLMSAMNEEYVLKNKSQIRNLLGHDSRLSEFGIIDSNKFGKMLENNQKTALAAPGIVCCCMTEIWMRSLEKTRFFDTNNQKMSVRS